MNEKCSLRVSIMSVKPRRALRNETLKSALKNFVVPCLSNRYNICAFRALWEVKKDDQVMAEMNIWFKRNEINEMIEKMDDCVAFFTCLTALDSGDMRRKLKEKKRRISADLRVSGSDTDNDYNSYEENGIIPGKKFSFNLSVRLLIMLFEN